MRYFALLYTPAESRDALTALFAIDAEIRESASSANHDVAHTRLQWWRQEIDRLVNDSAQHPAARILAAQRNFDRRQFQSLHELIVAADMDLARMTYLNLRELRAYAARSTGAMFVLAVQMLAARPLSEPERSLAMRLGIGVRQSEMLRDVRQDAYEGRVYVPLEDLQKHGVGLEDLRSAAFSDDVRAVLASFDGAIRHELDLNPPDLPRESRAYFRPLAVLAAQHRRLLERIADRRYEVATQRVELGPVEKPWVAWQAARRCR